MKLSKICELLDGELVGDGEIEITGLAKIEEARYGDITFLANPKYQKFVETTSASAILVSASAESIPIPHIKVENPYLAFQKTLSIFFPPHVHSFRGKSDLAFIDSTAKIGKNCTISPFVYIGKNVKIGENCYFHPGSVINDEVEIGDNSTFYANVNIREKCKIGSNVILHSGVIVGSDGFGFAPEQAAYHKIPQVGIVAIEDDVEIGANCTIDRATLGETRIKRGCKIDNLVQIAHNVVLGENTVIAAQSGVAGSAKTGKNVTLAAQVGIVGHVEVGDRAIIAGQSGVSKSVPPGEIWFGYPAQPISKQKRMEVAIRRLPDLAKTVKDLEKKIRELEQKLKNTETADE